MEVTASETRSHGGVALIACKHCQTAFVPSRPSQVFCGHKCRAAYHVDHGHQGAVKSVRRLKSGWSITLHVDDASGFQLAERVRLVRT
jgi:hypothetical protein